MRAGAPGPTARGRLFARELGRSLRWEKAVKNPVDKFCRMQYNISHIPALFQTSVWGKAALVGEIAVPCSCNPLQQG